jgi:hypothetical protein
LRPFYFTAALSWLGLWFHDAREFPGTAGISVDSVAMGLIAALLVLAAWRAPRARWPVVAMLVYGALMLIGGGLSVLPLPILPFTPEQSYAHYLSHAVYAAAQLPLVVACLHHSRPILRPESHGRR